jgi:hypothetical protein
MATTNFNQTIDTWIKELDSYSFEQLCAKPSPESWSLGQVYVHVIEATHYFIKQINICATSDNNMNEEAFPAAKTMFLKNDFPDLRLEGPPSNASTVQPASKEQILTGLMNLKEDLHKAETLVATSTGKGKTRHFGLNYFSAEEWLQFAEMHMRHHLRQKKRIDEFLNPGHRD